MEGKEIEKERYRYIMVKKKEKQPHCSHNRWKDPERYMT
jgi:hypothetical protein